MQGGWYRTLVASNEALAGLLQTLAALEAGDPAASEAWTHAGLARCGGRCVLSGGRADLTEVYLGSAAIGSQWVQPFRHGDPIGALYWL